jgi:diguanylate cyclase (GGDEF)-like protein
MFPMRGGAVTATGTRAGSTDHDAEILASPVYRIATWSIAGLGLIYASTTIIPFEERPQFLDTWFYSTVLVLTCLLALARPVLITRNRRAWACVALAVTSWSVGDIYWSAAFSSIDSSEIPVPSLADIFYVGMYPLAYAGFILLARATVKRLPPSVWLDGVVTSFAAGAVFSAYTLNDILSSTEGVPFAEAITNLSYPIGDLLLMVVTVAALAMVRWRPDPVWWLLGLGAASFAVADTAYLFGLANDSYVDGSWVDGMWMLGLTMMTLAGSINRVRRAEEIRGFAALLVPILFSLSALGVLILGTFVSVHPVSIFLASGCLVAAGIRTALTFEQTLELARSRLEARTDELSGLGNRRLLDDHLPAMMASLPGGAQLVLTIVSIDHLPEINSIMGYTAGDMIVNTVGTRLKESLPEDAISARLGGAEMAVLRVVRGADAATVDRQSRELLTTLAAPVPAGQMPVHIELSVGVAAAPVHATNPVDLIRCAADALRNAKANRSEVEIYDPNLDIGNEFGSRLYPDLLRALSEGEFVTYYQPKVDLMTGRPVAMEGILNWHHPTRGVIDGSAVQPLALRVGLTRQLTRNLLEAALRSCAAWRNQGVALGVAADLTAADVLDVMLPYDLAKLINALAIPPSVLTLEISEEVLLIDPRRTAVALGQFRHFGVRLALDHYGRSAPSLARLRTMPVDELKLDPSFVTPMLNSPQDAAVVRSTVELARSLNIATYVEGVDSRELLDAVTACGCVGVQGAVVGGPMTANALRAWLAQAVAAARPAEQASPRRDWRRDFMSQRN